MKVTHPILCLLTATVLVACGGGGGSNNNLNINSQNSQPNNIPANQNGANNPARPAASKFNNNGITKAVAQDKTLYSFTHSWKVVPPTGALAAEVQKAVANTNKLRAEVGASNLKYDERLSAYAQRRAEEIVRLFNHKRLNGQEIYVGFANGNRGENIAAGYGTADATVLTQWRNSKGHYENMIAKGFTKIGIGVVYVPGSTYRYYWVQIFGSDATTSSYYFDSSIAETNNPTPLKSLRVDGVDIPLNVQSGQWRNIHANNHSGMVSGYAHTRFGVIKNNSTNLYQTFYQGTPTATMPTTGSAKYVGQGVIVNGQHVNNQVTAQFNVNFVNKNLTGSLSNNGKNPINLQANITGNTFHSKIGADVETHGGFFGDNAAELAGDFREQKANGRIGVFGARKQ